MSIPQLHPFRSRSGLTLVEVLVALTILVVSSGMLARTMIATTGQRAINHENSVVLEAARQRIEELREAEFSQLFALYNDDPADDPGGDGTAPGHRFAVFGLRPLDDVEDGLCGEVILPVVHPGLGTVELREDVVDERLGLPRDFNGDNVVDAENRAGDYLLLPVRVRIDWQGRLGPRTYRLETMLTDYRRRTE